MARRAGEGRKDSLRAWALPWALEGVEALSTCIPAPPSEHHSRCQSNRYTCCRLILVLRIIYLRAHSAGQGGMVGQLHVNSLIGPLHPRRCADYPSAAPPPCSR